MLVFCCQLPPVPPGQTQIWHHMSGTCTSNHLQTQGWPLAEKEGKPQVLWFEDGTGWAKAMVEEYEAPRWPTHATIGSDASYFTNCKNTTLYSQKDITRLSWEGFLVWDSEQSDTESEGYSLYNNSDENMKIHIYLSILVCSAWPETLVSACLHLSLLACTHLLLVLISFLCLSSACALVCLSPAGTHLVLHLSPAQLKFL